VANARSATIQWNMLRTCESLENAALRGEPRFARLLDASGLRVVY
jgi:hypothetical protein